MQEFGLVLAITVLAVISPGGDFAMVTRNSYLPTPKMEYATCSQIAKEMPMAVQIPAMRPCKLLQTSPVLLQMVKTIGALYLLYIAWQTWQHPIAKPALQSQTSNHFTPWQALKTGLISNAFNPKTTLFVLSLYSQVIGMNTAMSTLLAYGLLISLAHLLWFAVVALALPQAKIRQCLLAKQQVVNKVIACVLMLLAGILLLT